MIPLAFANAGMLAALILLPAIWYFLRLTPPRPRQEAFPPTRLLLNIARKEEQPARSPWWLTAMRLALAAAVILALAGPIYNPVSETAPGDGSLLVVVDNGWASAGEWDAITDSARRVVDLAAETNRPLAVIATADGPAQSLAPGDASAAMERIGALVPHPWYPDYGALIAPLADEARPAGFGGAVWLASGVDTDGADAFAEALTAAVDGAVTVYRDSGQTVTALAPVDNGAEALTVPVLRSSAEDAMAGIVRGRDTQGRVIGEAEFLLAAGEATGQAAFTIPVELRNDIVRLEIDGVDTAGAVQLTDDRWKRRRIGLISGASADTAQPLLSPLHYISNAAGPFADLIEPRDANASVAVPELIDAGVSIVVLADIGTLSPDVEEVAAGWVRAGGTLVRFAGPRLAADTDGLIPVTLRRGDRILGGSLSWETPQPLATFADRSPFAGLPVPGDVVVTRQVLAEPDGNLAERTWAALADGTPLVTADRVGRGWLILFHVTADTSWSNLPLSGTFVEMLRRIIAFSANVGDAGTDAGAGSGQPIAPFRLLDGFGRFEAPGPRAQPLVGNVDSAVASEDNPPGLYGTEDGFRALNLIRSDAPLANLDPALPDEAEIRPYPTQSPYPLMPWLLALAAALIVLDTLAVLWLNGGWRLRRGAAAAVTLVAGSAAMLAGIGHPRADDATDRMALEAANTTRLAYVVTGVEAVDEVSRGGLDGLSRVLAARTALEPGTPMGIDPARDELAFFPLIYWPVLPETDLPTADAMARIGAYMRQGGSVLFDTRDQLDHIAAGGTLGATPAVERLRDMLATLDIPPLEPVPADHVLTKSFYLLSDFPGRYAGGPLWVEVTEAERREDRPARAGDGVSTILITSNDFAGAWSVDDAGNFLYPTVPPDRMQREMSLRTGINIVMYTLTGNYKADQVHVPALLERLGQ